MANEFIDLAIRHAPVLWQKVSKLNPDGDCITRVDLGGSLDNILDNWHLVNKKLFPLAAEAYYSVVETFTHYFILYAFYHPQDWYDGETVIDIIRSNFDEHLHDMEGALAVVTKKDKKPEEERVDAFITVSHYHFYCYANWKRTEEVFEFPEDDPWQKRIHGFKESLDGNIWFTFDKLKGKKTRRFNLYAQAKGHGIRGDRKKWGGEKHVIRYFPSADIAEVPRSLRRGYVPGHDGYKYQDVRYRLIDFFEDGGLWSRKDDTNVFQANAKGQDAFVKREKEEKKKGKKKGKKQAKREKVVAGSANPPWGWDDTDDRHKCGELAINPAGIVHDYLKGMREFSLEYMHNPYLNISRF
jgi:hypothetical protein